MESRPSAITRACIWNDLAVRRKAIDKRMMLNALLLYIEVRCQLCRSLTPEYCTVTWPQWTFLREKYFFFNFPDLPRTEHKSWLPAIVFTIKTLLKQEGSKTADQTDEEQSATSKLPPCSDFMTTQTAVLFKCDSVNVVVIPLNDWEPMGSFTALYKQSLGQPADAQLL